MNTHFVIGDVHGHYDLLLDLLKEAGIAENSQTRLNKEVNIIQIGDLVNGTEDSRGKDILCLEIADKLIDVYIVGNHEGPFLGISGFNGFAPNPEAQIWLNRFDRLGKLVPSRSIGNTLITHSGICRGYEGEPTSAREFNDFLYYLWQNRGRNHEIFESIGPLRGGRNMSGGILWSDWREAKHREFNQIIGHTPMKEAMRRDHPSTGTWVQHIDVGGKLGRQLCGAWVDDEGEVEDLIIIEKER